MPADRRAAVPGTAAPTLRAVSERRSLRDEVSAALRAAPIAGELRPGVAYSAPALAAQFGVSATPVREAMQDLAKEGVVEVVRNKGFRVTEMSSRDLDEYTDIRTLIEVPAVGRVARAADRERLEELRPLCREIVAAARRSDLVGYLEADRRFHLELLALADNRRLVEVVADLRNRARLYGLTELAEQGRLKASAEEHETLLDHILAGDAEAAEARMADHLAHVRSLWADDARR